MSFFYYKTDVFCYMYVQYVRLSLINKIKQIHFYVLSTKPRPLMRFPLHAVRLSIRFFSISLCETSLPVV